MNTKTLADVTGCKRKKNKKTKDCLDGNLTIIAQGDARKKKKKKKWDY